MSNSWSHYGGTTYLIADGQYVVIGRRADLLNRLVVVDAVGGKVSWRELGKSQRLLIETPFKSSPREPFRTA